MKYVNADKIRKAIESEANNWKDTYTDYMRDNLFIFLDYLQQETSEISLEKFTEKMEDWKARYNYPDNIPIKATIAFTARMFYMYPDVARQWYDSLPKITQD